MSTVAELLVKIGADTSDLRKEVAATKRQLRTAFGTEAMDFSSKATAALGGLSVALGALGVVAVKAGGELQNVQVAMANMLGSADKATGFIKELQYFAAHTPFEFNDVTKASQKFLAFGFTAEQIIPTLTAVGDAAAGVGAGQEGVNRLTVALGQIAAKGKLASQEMMQITELGIPAWKLLADKLGTDVATAQDMVTKRMVDSKMALEALVEGMEKNYGGMMAQQSSTILGTWSNLMDGLGQVASQAGLKISEALNLPSLFSGAGDFLSDFAAEIERSGIAEAFINTIPPGVQIAIIGFATALTAIAIPAMVAAGSTALAMVAPFVTAIGAAVACAAPFIGAITAIVTTLYALYTSGVTVSDVLNIMGVRSETLSETWTALKSAFSSLGSVFMTTISALSPLFVGLGAIVASTGALILKIFGGIVNSLLWLVTSISNAIKTIANAFEWLVSVIGQAIDMASSALRNMADSVLPSWASSGLSTISSFVGSATNSLNSLISKIFDTNKALESTSASSEPASKGQDTSNQKKWQRPNFDNFKGANPSLDGEDGSSKGTKSTTDLSASATSTSKSIEEEWVKTFNTKSELVERWYKEETAELDKSKAYNENYERDRQRLTELYSQKRITALQEEAKTAQEIQAKIRDASYSSRESKISLNGDSAEAELLKMSLAHEKTVSAIEDRWTTLSNTFIGLNEQEREIFIKALEERGIAYEQSASGELSFHKEMLEEKLAADKAYEDQKAAYHAECRDIQAEIDEAYRLNDLARLQEVLTEENAIRLNEMEAQKAMMDTYMEAFLMQHTTISQLVSDLYSTALGGLESAFTGILSGSKSAKQAFSDLGKSMIKVIAQYFAKQLAGMIVSHAMGESIKKKETATGIAEANAQLAAWAPVAVAYETVHPGSAARAMATVSAALAAATAIGSTMQALNQGTGAASNASSTSASIPGFASGGYFTGPTLGIIGEGPDNEVALPLNRAVFSNIAEGIVNASDSSNTTVTQNIYGDINEAADVDDLFSCLNDMVAAGLRGA